MTALAGFFIGVGIWFGLADLGANLYNGLVEIAKELERRK